MRAETVKINFTQRVIEKLPVPAKGYSIIYDTQVGGLGLAVSETGSRHFHWFRSVKGKPIWRSLGSYPALSLEAARMAAGEKNTLRERWKASSYAGPSPFEREKEPEPAPEVFTLSKLLDAYVLQHLREHAKRPAKAEKSVRWVVKKYLSEWKDRPAAEITAQEVSALHRKIGAKHTRTANAVVKLLRTLYRFAIKADLFKGDLPTRSVSFYHEPRRTRFLQPDELHPLFTALKAAPNQDLRAFVSLALWTGARKSDVLSMRWADISLADNRWTIPDPKNRTPYSIPLTPEAGEILEGRPRIENNPWVFPSVGKSGHVVDLKGAWREMLIAAKLHKPGDAELRLTIHDLRRTQGSWLAGAGVSLPIIGKALGHQSMQATSIYSRVNIDPVRAAMTASNRAMVVASRKKVKALPPARRLPKSRAGKAAKARAS